MERRKAIAVAAAVTMSLTSGVLAAGTIGAFGFGGGAGAAAAKRDAVVVSAPANPTATAKASGERERGEGAEHSRANNATSTRGEQNG